jgi:hypothetical protein
MAESSQHPPPPPGGPAAIIARPAAAMTGFRALLATLAIAAGGALLGVAAGFIWSAVAPQAVFAVQSRGVAYVVNPETSAFIAADGWFCLIGAIGGAIIGVAGYLAGVRRYGPLPAAGVLAGATAAAFLAWWVGSHVGLADFRHRLAIGRPGSLLRQPADLGAHGALTFWPLAAGIVVGGIELVIALRERQHARSELGAPAPYWPLPPGRRSSHPGRHARTDLDGHAPRPGLDGQAGLPGLDGRDQRSGLDGHAPQPGLDGHAQPRDIDGQPGWRQADWRSDQYDR